MHKYNLEKMKRAKARQTKFREFLGCTLIALISVIGTVGVAYGRDILNGINIRTGELITAEPVYLICDVIENYNADEYTTLVVELPNGELHEYSVTDAPEGQIDEVCLYCPNGNDAPPSEYEVVALR